MLNRLSIKVQIFTVGLFSTTFIASAQSIGDTRNVTATTHRVSVTTSDMTTKPPGTHTYSYDLYLYNTCTGTSYDNAGWTNPFSALKNDLAFHFVWSGSLTVPSGKIGKIIVSKTHTAYGSSGGNENIDANELLGGEVYNGSTWEIFAWSRDERTYTNVSGTTVIEDLPGAGGGANCQCYLRSRLLSLGHYRNRMINR